MKKIVLLLGMLSMLMCFNPFNAEAAVDIRDSYVSDEYVEVHTPVVSSCDKEVAENINSYLKQELDAYFANVEELKQLFEAPVYGTVSYKVTYQTDYVLSMVMTEYTSPMGAAHPSTVEKAVVFGLNDGRPLTLDTVPLLLHGSQAPGYTLEQVEQALRTQAAEQGIQLNESFHGLAELPDNFYVDQDKHVHVIFNRYEVAAYAFGAVDIDLDK